MKHLSLKLKVSIIVAAATLLLTALLTVLSYREYSTVVDEHYNTLAMDIAKTAASLVDGDQVARYRKEVYDIYKENVAPEYETQEEWDQYFAQYEGIIDEEYGGLLEILDKVRQSNQADDVYIVYMDPETRTCVYIADPATGEDACPPGTWDIVYENNYEALTHPEDGFPAYITNSEYGWLCSAGAPIFDSQGNVAAHVMTDVSMNDIMQDRHDFLRNLCVILVAAAVFAALVLFTVTNRLIVRPVQTLTEAADSYVTNRSQEDGEAGKNAMELLNIKTGDEIETLAAAMKKMERDINDYIVNLARVTSEKERIGAELSIATEIQASMLPRIFPPFPDRQDLNIYAVMNPAREVGGDFYDFFLIDDTHLAITVADVSGKGVPAALFMVIAKTLIKDRACSFVKPGEIFTWVNQQLCESNQAGLFVTAWLGIIDLKSGLVEYVNAGHNPPLVALDGGEFAYLKQKSGFILAGLEGFAYETSSFQMSRGDRIFLYTDGVTEAMNRKDKLFGEKRLLEWMNLHRKETPEAVLHGLRGRIADFADGAEQYDDITMLMFERL